MKKDLFYSSSSLAITLHRGSYKKYPIIPWISSGFVYQTQCSTSSNGPWTDFGSPVSISPVIITGLDSDKEYHVRFTRVVTQE